MYQWYFDLTNCSTLKLLKMWQILQKPEQKTAIYKLTYTSISRHDVYTHQYRAMFVSHCAVDLQEVLKYPKETSKRKQKKKTKFTASDGSPVGASTDSTAEFDVYHPVRCTECNTLVAMYDQEEIYHFFNVLSSY